MGSAVFFWHGLARGDIPKHLSEAMGDNTLPAQVAALRCIVALIGANSVADAGEPVRTPLRKPGPVDDFAELMGLRPQSCGDDALKEPLDVARDLVWPRGGPAFAAPLTKRARVSVLVDGKGGGGGLASWPQILRQRLLGASEDH